MSRKEKKKKQLKEWKRKTLHGQFARKTEYLKESKKMGVVEERIVEKGD